MLKKVQQQQHHHLIDQKIIGIDPGLHKTGWGIIQKKSGKFYHVAHGVFKTPTAFTTSQKLFFLYENLKKILEEHAPTHAVIENIFLNKNPLSTLTLGFARGVALMTPSALQIPVTEYSSTHIKKTITNNGHASKSQIMKVVSHILSLKTMPPADASDALAIALCFLYHPNF